MAGAHAQAADGLQGRIGHGHTISAQGQCLAKIGRMPEAAGDNQRHIRGITVIQVSSRACQRRNGGDGYVVPEDQWRSRPYRHRDHRG